MSSHEESSHAPPDPALVALAELVEAKGLTLYIGLELKGQRIWGTTVKFDSWLRNASMSIKGERPSEAAESVADLAVSAVLGPGKDDAKVLHKGFLHLKAEQFNSPLDDEKPEYDFWRIRLTDVSGWSLSS